MESKLNDFLEMLTRLPSEDGLMNPYASARCPDAPAAFEEVGAEADQLRLNNLENYVRDLVTVGSDVLLCGEAPGYQGCRFSGIAFTSERELVQGEFPLNKCRVMDDLRQGRRPMMKEPSALYVWRALERAPSKAILWNAVQLHPHEPGKPLSNRTPTKEEVELGRESLELLIELVQPRLIVALGKTAERALARIGVDAEGVRHPSYGGAAKMERQLEELGVIGPAPPPVQRSLFDDSRPKPR